MEPLHTGHWRKSRLLWGSTCTDYTGLSHSVNQDRWKILSRKTFITLKHLLNYLSIYFKLACRSLLLYFLCCQRNISAEVQPLTLFYTPFVYSVPFIEKWHPFNTLVYHAASLNFVAEFCTPLSVRHVSAPKEVLRNNL